MKFIMCLIFGHEKYIPNKFKYFDLINVKGFGGKDLLSVNVCKRCGKLYVIFLGDNCDQ